MSRGHTTSEGHCSRSRRRRDWRSQCRQGEDHETTHAMRHRTCHAGTYVCQGATRRLDETRNANVESLTRAGAEDRYLFPFVFKFYLVARERIIIPPARRNDSGEPQIFREDVGAIRERFRKSRCSDHCRWRQCAGSRSRITQRMIVRNLRDPVNLESCAPGGATPAPLRGDPRRRKSTRRSLRPPWLPRGEHVEVLDLANGITRRHTSQVRETQAQNRLAWHVQGRRECHNLKETHQTRFSRCWQLPRQGCEVQTS